MKKFLITLMLLLASAQVMAAQPLTSDQEQRAQKMIADFLFNDPNSPRIGAKNPKLTLVVFTDYNCPYCKKFDPYLEKIVEKHPDVAVVFKFLPYRSESSLTAARDALTLPCTKFGLPPPRPESAALSVLVSSRKSPSAWPMAYL